MLATFVRWTAPEEYPPWQWGVSVVITLRAMFFSVSPLRRMGDRGLSSSAAIGSSGLPAVARLPKRGTEHHAERDDCFSLTPLRKGADRRSRALDGDEPNHQARVTLGRGSGARR